MFQVSTLDLCKLHTGLQLASKLVSLFHCMARLGSARVFIFNWQKLQLVPGTWHFIWYHLSQGSKRVEPILKAKTLETADRSERIVTCTIRDVLHKPAVLNGQAIINRDCNFFIHSKKKKAGRKTTPFKCRCSSIWLPVEGSSVSWMEKRACVSHWQWCHNIFTWHRHDGVLAAVENLNDKHLVPKARRAVPYSRNSA